MCWDFIGNLFSGSDASAGAAAGGTFGEAGTSMAGGGPAAGAGPLVLAPGGATFGPPMPAGFSPGGGVGVSPAAGAGIFRGADFAPGPGGFNPITGAASDGMGSSPSFGAPAFGSPTFGPVSPGGGFSPALNMASSLPGGGGGIDLSTSDPGGFGGSGPVFPQATPIQTDPITGLPLGVNDATRASAVPITDTTLSGMKIPSSATSGIMDFIKKNPGLLLGAGGIGLAALQRPSIPNLNNLTSAGNAVQTTANALLPAEQTGQLPPGMQSIVSNSLADSIAAIKAKYSGMNLSGSSSEQQEISAAQERSAAETADLAMKVTQQGLNAAGLSEKIFVDIANLRISQDNGLRDAIASFAGGAGFGAGASAIRSATS